jgi:hypothetical protein
LFYDYRAHPEKCLLMAGNDHEAIAAWLASKRRTTDDKELSATQRSYRKEAERLLLWAILERKKALSSLSVEDGLLDLTRQSPFGLVRTAPPSLFI